MILILTFVIKVIVLSDLEHILVVKNLLIKKVFKDKKLYKKIFCAVGAEKNLSHRNAVYVQKLGFIEEIF